MGNVVWFLLGFPTFIALVVAQLLLYRRLTMENPFNDVVVATALIVQAVTGLVIAFYFGIKNEAPKR
jgi:hypothetical protein